MPETSFEQWFAKLTGHETPRPWQAGLGAEPACRNRLIRIPTGMGKTEGVLATWSYYRLHGVGASWPRRLVWCLPMRVLVEQTEHVAQQLAARIPEPHRPAVHVAMGGEDAGEWFLHPERPAIIIGTQDMLLSRALNRGYASGRARWPMEFGLLNQDTLWVMDEVQLMDAGLATSAQLQAYREQDQAKQLRSCQPGEQRGYGWEQVSLMAAIPANDYESWRTKQIQEAERPFEGKKRTAALQKKIAKAIEPYPNDLLTSLTLDTSVWKQHGWSQPPGSQRVLYWRRSDALQVGVPAQHQRPQYHSVTTMLLAITTPSGNKSALPSVARTLPQAELFHRAIVGRLGQGRRVCCPELTGRDEHGNPLHDNHGHAHTLPVDLDGDGRIDHIIVHAKMGLRDSAQQAIRTLRRTWTKGGAGELQVAVVGSGDLEMLRQLPPPFNRQIDGLLGPPAGSRIWESTTPFVFARFLKPRGKNNQIGQINAELAMRQLPEVVDVRVDPILTHKLRHFVQRRYHGGAPPPVDAGYGLKLTFAEPLSVRGHGPLTLGYAAHYGLGLFKATDPSSDQPVMATG